MTCSKYSFKTASLYSICFRGPSEILPRSFRVKRFGELHCFRRASGNLPSQAPKKNKNEHLLPRGFREPSESSDIVDGEPKTCLRHPSEDLPSQAPLRKS